MAVSSINNYNNIMYQWQAQQLKSNGSSTTTSSAISSLFGNTASMSNQLSSMIELTKYAMDNMGLSSDSRVTFSQITKYRNQLQSEFNQGVKQGFADSGLKNINALIYTLDKSGKISVASQFAEDRARAQSWLDANFSLSADLMEAFEDRGLAGDINFTISSTGKISLINGKQNAAQSALSSDEALQTELRTAFEQLGFNTSVPINLSFDGHGNLIATGDHSVQMNDWLETNSSLSVKVKGELEKLGVDPASVSLRINSNGSLQVSITSEDFDNLQAALDDAQATGKKIFDGLNNLKIDANANFSIQIAEDGSLNIISDHPDRDKIQRFFNEHPELVKKFRQIETLAGIDDARKAMQISPSEMRKRIQIESMASWWATSGNAASYFGAYNNSNGLSLLSGLNLNV